MTRHIVTFGTFSAGMGRTGFGVVRSNPNQMSAPKQRFDSVKVKVFEPIKVQKVFACKPQVIETVARQSKVYGSTMKMQPGVSWSWKPERTKAKRYSQAYADILKLTR